VDSSLASAFLQYSFRECLQHELVGQMVGELRGLDEDQDDVQIVDESDEEEEVQTSKSR
jgi:hypothetical protein